MFSWETIIGFAVLILVITLAIFATKDKDGKGDSNEKKNKKQKKKEQVKCKESKYKPGKDYNTKQPKRDGKQSKSTSESETQKNIASGNEQSSKKNKEKQSKKDRKKQRGLIKSGSSKSSEVDPVEISDCSTKETSDLKDAATNSPILSVPVETVKIQVDKSSSEIVSFIEKNPPADVSYSYLRVFDGKLLDAVPNKAIYYRKWTFKGVIYYEFCCDSSLIEKAINNKSAIIEPYCEKHSSSVMYESATGIQTVEFGTLNSDNSIIKKTIIKYI